MRSLYNIGGMRLDADARVLTHDGEPVALGPRAVAVLVVLVSRPNEAVAKAEIMDTAWPGLVVEEANLAVQISALRRALARVPGGDGWIETLARRGYRFVGPVSQVAGTQAATRSPINRRRTNFPQVLTSFVGREREIAEIKQLLPVTRLLTLTGTGGIGKTRLALQVGHEVLDAYGDGAWFIDLAPLSDQALVAGAMAQTLGLKEEAGKPLVATISRHLRNKDMLLVLDNCEHVLGASADLVDALLRETAHVTIFATSRQLLRVTSERAYSVAALPVPDPKAISTTIAHSDAVKLFVDRARQQRPSFDLDEQRSRAVAQICVRLDGLPLALELAAARVAVLPVDEILRLLDQRFRLLTRGGELPRQQTLRAMIDWSYELLTEAEQRLFARLSTFAGGWAVAAAEAVGADAAIPRADVVYLMIALIEKSLVASDEDGNRYRMLESIREYASEKLAAAADAGAVRTRHRDFFVALAEEADQKLRGAQQTEWLQRLEQEHDNLRAALEGCLTASATSAGFRLCWSLRQFWWTRGHVTEGRQWCARILAQPGGNARSKEHADALSAAGALAYLQADYAASKALHEESLAIRRALGDRRGVATSLSNLGVVSCDHREFAAALVQFNESLEILRELNDPWGVAIALGNLGRAANEQGEFAVGRARLEESLAIKRTLGNPAGIANSLSSLASAVHGQGDYAAAEALHAESLSINQELGNRRGIAAQLQNLGSVALDRHELDLARERFAESMAIERELGDRRNICNSLEGFGSIAAMKGKAQNAARIWGAATRLREEIDSPRSVVEIARHERLLASARAAAGDGPAFDRAWQEGRALALDDAMDFALTATSR